jgi:hypothetical protein
MAAGSASPAANRRATSARGAGRRRDFCSIRGMEAPQVWAEAERRAQQGTLHVARW